MEMDETLKEKEKKKRNPINERIIFIKKNYLKKETKKQRKLKTG